MDLQNKKYETLKQYLADLGSVAIAFSGGVDSTFLLKVAHEVLGDRALAVTAQSVSFPVHELNETKAFCQQEGIRQVLCKTDELNNKAFISNPPNRCYICKHAIFSQLWDAAKTNGISHLAEGSHVDDMSEYRPGMQAIQELKVKSPLRHVGLTKTEIRALSATLGLPTANKPSFGCLVTRLPYGETITQEKLDMIDAAEQLLLNLGFVQVRVRMHGDIARIEILPEQFAKMMESDCLQTVYRTLREIGFTYVSLDLGGYRFGSMDETL